ncbi:unnamed protein product [Pseudo-nitzschia multistriata]|uniref:Uncharacterized protein n=1 Tax=Pseudo-nitzschia multistriata TaxID=183589 RepID=A0A448YZR9_9STRA|nr:unnamed protein product [Pseudo-nitzschia multistriata]
MSIAIPPAARPPPSVSLGVGRERRVPGQKQQRKTNEHRDKQAQRLIEQEESARRKRIEQMDQRLQKAARRDVRISILEAKIALEQQEQQNGSSNSNEVAESITEPNGNSSTSQDIESVTDAERAELAGLLRVREDFEEQYDPSDFSEEHLNFKDLHNDAFLKLVQYCERNRGDYEKSKTSETNKEENITKVFFLDGPDARTASALIWKGNMDATQCYVANRHESTCVCLRQSGGGLLPDANVVHATASEALSKPAFSNDRKQEQHQVGAFAHLDFTGYYFDGCNGFAPHIVNMLSSALLRLDQDDSNGQSFRQQHPIVVGYSLIGGGHKTQATMVENELFVSRALTTIARTRGMRVIQALDDPTRFGLHPETPKVAAKTFTTWLLLEPDDSF